MYFNDLKYSLQFVLKNHEFNVKSSLNFIGFYFLKLTQQYLKLIFHLAFLSF